MPPFSLQNSAAGLCVVSCDDADFLLPAPDFTQGAAAHRRQFGGGKSQMIAKACGVKDNIRPSILDATAGFGQDAFVLASLGCQLFLIERHPLIGALLEDALRRAENDESTREIMSRMQLMKADAIVTMQSWHNLAMPTPQVIYLDPMFPPRQKSAQVKKEMRLFRALAGNDEDAAPLFAAAFALASHRVVVKRPRHAPLIGEFKPSFVLEGAASRFDIYAKQKLGITNNQKTI